MSSMRNAVQRRNHRERAQPDSRTKWGILEKPKDYKLRAADHKSKRQKIKHLQQKASERNEDEFYFGMVNSESRGGVKVAKRGEENSGGSGAGRVMGRDVVGLMKTQDVGYLRTVLQRCRREREGLEREVVGGEVGVKTQVPAAGKKVFGEDGEDLAVKAPQKQPSDDMEDLDGLDDSSNDGDGSESEAEDGDMSVEEKRKARKLEAKRRKLQFLKDRERDLTTALNEVETQRAKMNGTVGGANKNGTTFKVRGRKK